MPLNVSGDKPSPQTSKAVNVPELVLLLLHVARKSTLDIPEVGTKAIRITMHIIVIRMVFVLTSGTPPGVSLPGHMRA